MTSQYVQKKMVRITKVIGRQVLDSRGNPTVEAEMHSATKKVRAIVPSGASTGVHEALELRDHKKAFGGFGVHRAVSNINKIIFKAVKNKNFSTQEEFDNFLIDLDGTFTKIHLGANAILTCSLAFARLLAETKKQPLYKQIKDQFKTKSITLPIPFANVINGGRHAGNPLEIQEFMIAPRKAHSFAQATQEVSETYHALRKIILKKYGLNAVNVGDEGGFAPPISSATQALNLLERAVKHSGYDLSFAMDAAASEYFKNHQYFKKRYSSESLEKFYGRLLDKYPIVSIEDPFAEDDIHPWRWFTEKFGRHTQIVGDDLTVTNPYRVKRAIEEKWCNSLLLKVNQIGTLTESLKAAHLARKARWHVMVSHRSGETEDSFISDLTVGMGVGQIKLGAPTRGERTAKYNQLLRIEEELGKRAKYAHR